MILEFLIGILLGEIIADIIEICIEVHNKLTARSAKKLAEEKIGKNKAWKMVFDRINEYPSENREALDFRCYDENNNHTANITFVAPKGSSFYKNQIIC